MRICTKCKKPRDSTDYYVGNPWCKNCKREYERERRAAKGDDINARRRERAADPERRAATREYNREYWKRNPEKLRAKNIMAAYGITAEEYDRLMADPCGICGALAEHLDHDHDTGRLRAAATYVESFHILTGGVV